MGASRLTPRCPGQSSRTLSGVRTTKRPYSALFADDLDRDVALPRSVELREDDGLEPSEGELAVVDAEGDGAPQDGRAQVRVGVAALAVGEARVVVAIAAALGDEAFSQALEIVHQCALELVDEDRAGGVQRVDQRD